MILAAALIAVAPCQHGVTLAEAKALVLASPSIRAAVARHHARPFFEAVVPGPDGWSFDVNSRTPCRYRNRPCSSWLGHFAVSRNGEVEDLDADGGAGVLISSAEIERLKKRFINNRC